MEMSLPTVIGERDRDGTHLLPDDALGIQRVADREYLGDVLVLEEVESVGHIVFLHVIDDRRIAAPAIEGHLVAAQMEILVAEHLHDLGEQIPHEVVDRRIRRIHRAQFAVRLSGRS